MVIVTVVGVTQTPPEGVYVTSYWPATLFDGSITPVVASRPSPAGVELKVPLGDAGVVGAVAPTVLQKLVAG